MPDYKTKSYGRNAEVASIYQLLSAGRDVAMPGPRRLGKTFLLDRLVDAADENGWRAVKVEIAGCQNVRSVFRELSSKIGRQQTWLSRGMSFVIQRLGQVVAPRGDHSGPWYQQFLSLDHEARFEHLMNAMEADKSQRWVLLIDEVPIFLKALHDRGPDGVVEARDFMNLLSRLRQGNPRVRWLITGSIGLEPLARVGSYLGVLAKFHTFELEPLTEAQALDLVQDLATEGRLLRRSRITDAEAKAIVAEVGWRAAYYLDALAQELDGDPSDDPLDAAAQVSAAVNQLVQPDRLAAFGTWEEHLRKHYGDPDRAHAFAALTALAKKPEGLSVDVILATIGRPGLTHASLRTLLTRLHVEGFVTMIDWDEPTSPCAFRNPLLRRWWDRFEPKLTA